MNTAHPEPIAYLRRLAACWPRAARITGADAQLASLLLRAGLIEIHAFKGAASRAGERPSASPLVRHQIARGQNPVTTLWHEPLDFSDEQPTLLMALLDGTRDRNEIAAAMQWTAEAVDVKLAEFGYYALLTS